MEMGFDLENIDVELDDFLDSYEDTPKYRSLPKIEFFDEVSHPFNRTPPFKF